MSNNPNVQSLIQRFACENDQLIAVVDQLGDEQCRTLRSTEGWPLLVAARHVGEDHLILAEIARAVAQGQPRPPISFAMLDQINARHAAEHADCSKSEAIGLLRANASRAAAIVGEISDDQLDATAPVFAGAPAMSVRTFLERVFVDHIVDHRASILKAISTASELSATSA
jgi:hypothetical protein